jgi:K+:H+ antiporter
VLGVAAVTTVLFERLRPIAIVLLTVLTAIATGAGVSASALGGTLLGLALFLVTLLGVGMLTVPRFVRMVLRRRRSST